MKGEFSALEDQLDSIQIKFKEAILENRTINFSKGDPTTGKVYMGDEAIAIGLVDGYATITEILNNSTSNKMETPILSREDALANALATISSLTQDELAAFNTSLALAATDQVKLVPLAQKELTAEIEQSIVASADYKKRMDQYAIDNPVKSTTTGHGKDNLDNGSEDAISDEQARELEFFNKNYGY
jgi:ClpP class serine protease